MLNESFEDEMLQGTHSCYCMLCGFDGSMRETSCCHNEQMCSRNTRMTLMSRFTTILKCRTRIGSHTPCAWCSDCKVESLHTKTALENEHPKTHTAMMLPPQYRYASEGSGAKMATLQLIARGRHHRCITPTWHAHAMRPAPVACCPCGGRGHCAGLGCSGLFLHVQCPVAVHSSNCFLSLESKPLPEVPQVLCSIQRRDWP